MDMCQFLLYMRDRQMRYLAGTVFLCYSIFGECRFCWSGFSVLKNLFS